MLATTLQTRIEKNLFTKKGTLNASYEKVIEFIKRGVRVHPCRWNRNNRHYTLIDNSHQYIDVLTSIGIDYVTGNDAPNGGAEGFFIELTAKGKRQVKSYVNSL